MSASSCVGRFFPAECVSHVTGCASTNDLAFELLGWQSPVLVWTSDQKMGRGTKGRAWSMPAGSGLALSLGFSFGGTENLDRNVPLWAAILVHQALVRWVDRADLSLKWPNDLMLRGKKCAGILCESRWQGRQVQVVIGIGINLFTGPHLEMFAKPAIALNEVIEPPQPEALVEAIRLSANRLWTNCATAEGIHAAWMARSQLKIGQRLQVLANGRQYVGTFAGLGREGGLLLAAGSGQVEISQSCDDFLLL